MTRKCVSIEFLALVKTSTGMSASGGTVGMTLAQIKPGQLKATLPGVRTPMQLQQIPIQQQQKRNNAAAGTSRFVSSRKLHLWETKKKLIPI